jgi:hypothetical protein
MSYAAKCYWPGVTQAGPGKAADCSSSVRCSFPTEETASCIFEGIESDVRAVSTQPGVSVERILESLRVNTMEPAKAQQ